MNICGIEVKFMWGCYPPASHANKRKEWNALECQLQHGTYVTLNFRSVIVMVAGWN